jgi:hypothetical protein
LPGSAILAVKEYQDFIIGCHDVIIGKLTGHAQKFSGYSGFDQFHCGALLQ